MAALPVTPEPGTGHAGRASKWSPRPEPTDVAQLGWQVLGWVGLALTVAAIGTMASVYVPTHFGNVDWEFGVVGESMVAMPLLTVGVGGCLAAAVARQRSSALLTLGVGFVLLVLWFAVTGILFSTTAVMAWQRVQDAPGLLALGVKRVIARTMWFGLIGGAGCCLAALYSFKTYVAGPRRNRA